MVLHTYIIVTNFILIYMYACVHMKRGGPRWMVWLGRRDSLKASFDGANQFIPAPNSSLLGLISNFKQQGLDIQDLVALSGTYKYT